MSVQEDNKAIVGRWFTEFWGETFDMRVVDEIAAPDMLLKYSLHEPRKGREDIKAFMLDFRIAFPDLRFWGTADLIAEGDHVVGQWEGGGTHTGPAFKDFPRRQPAGRDGPEDALHRAHRPEAQGRQDRPGDRPG